MSRPKNRQRNIGNYQTFVMIAAIIAVAALLTLLQTSGVFYLATHSGLGRGARVLTLPLSIGAIIGLFYAAFKISKQTSNAPVSTPNHSSLILAISGILITAFTAGALIEPEGRATYGFTALWLLPGAIVMTPLGWGFLLLVVCAIILSKNPALAPSLRAAKTVVVLAFLIFGALIFQLMTTPIPDSTE